MMRRPYFFGEAFSAYVTASLRENPNIEMPPDSGSIPLLPDEEHGPPVDEPPDQPRKPEDQPDPPPIREPNPSEPTRLF
jgi:hypothetical protein